MKVGSLVRVTLNGIAPFVGVAIAANCNGGHLVRSIDGNYEYWVYEWSTHVNFEVISENR